MEKISIAPEKLGTLFGWLPLTNTLFTTWVVMGIMILIGILATRKMKVIPSGAQNFAEMIIEGGYSVIEEFMGSEKKARKFFGFIITIFFFILFSNWFGLLPGFGAITLKHEPTKIEASQKSFQVDEKSESKIIEETTTIEKTKSGEKESTEEEEVEHLKVFRAGTTDLSITIGLALMAVVMIQIAGFQSLGLHYLGKFLNFKSPVMFFVGILEIISEISKMVSLSFRLFGNIFAGEVLLVVMTFIVPVLVPTPFLGLEVLVGVIQATVFSFITLLFLKSATEHH